MQRQRTLFASKNYKSNKRIKKNLLRAMERKTKSERDRKANK